MQKSVLLSTQNAIALQVAQTYLSLDVFQAELDGFAKVEAWYRNLLSTKAEGRLASA